METQIEIFAIAIFSIIGLSHIVQHRAWAEFISGYVEQGRPGVFKYSLMTLLTGALIVAFHNQWSGLPLVLTVIGWSMLLKSATAFLFPELALRSMATAQVDKSHLLIVPGIIFMIVAIILSYSIWNSTGLSS